VDIAPQQDPARRIAQFAVAVVSLGIVLLLAWSRLFGRFLDYDDQGYLQAAVGHVLDGRRLYDEVTLPYGPAYFLERWLVHGVLQVPLTTDGVRLVTLATWLAAAALVVAALRGVLPRDPARWCWLVVGFLIVGCSLQELAQEPGHPQELYLLASCGAFALLACAPGARARSIAAGALVGVLLCTKVNVGVFAGVACLAAGLVADETRLFGKLLRWGGVLGALALPHVITAAHAETAGGFALESLLGLAAVAACDLRLGRAGSRGSSHHAPRTAWLFVGALAGAALGLGFALATGSSFDALVYELVERPRQFASGFHVGAPILPGARLVLIGGVVLALAWAFGAELLRRRIEFFVPWLRALLFLLVAYSAIDPYVSFSYAPGLAWLWLLPSSSGSVGSVGSVGSAGSAASEASGAAAWRRFLVWYLVLERLQAFPVYGSHLRMGMLAALPLATWGAWASWGTILRARFATAAAALAGCVAGAVAIAQHHVSDWRARAPIDLPGVRLVRDDPARGAVHRWLALNLAHSSTFVASTGWNSLYSWSGRPAPDTTLVSHTWELIPREQQTRLAQALLASPEPWFLDHPSFFGRAERAQQPFFQALSGRFRPVGRCGKYTLHVLRERPDPQWVACASPVPAARLPAALRQLAGERSWFEVDFAGLPTGVEVRGVEVWDMEAQSVVADAAAGVQLHAAEGAARAGHWTLSSDASRGWLALPPSALPPEQKLRTLRLVRGDDPGGAGLHVPILAAPAAAAGPVR